MPTEIQKLIKRCIIRYLNGDEEEFYRLRNKAIDMYEHHRHLYVPIKEIIEAKKTA